MKKYLLPEVGNFYKANLHLHSNLSDGQLSPEEIKKLYMEHGYSIVAYTDHEVIIPHNDLTDDNFLAITSYELAVNESNDLPWPKVKTVHLNFYAKDKNNIVPPCFNEAKIWDRISGTKPYVTDEMRANKYDFKYCAECINEVVAKANAAGFLVSYNHPVWSLQNREDYIDYKGIWGVEVYNNECYKMGYLDTTTPLDDLLRAGERVRTLATDDSHSASSSCGGYVMVKADKLEYNSIMTALENGDFYSSTGPEIRSLTFEDGVIRIECSDVKDVIVNTDKRISLRSTAEAGKYINCREFDMKYWMNESEKLPEKMRDDSYFRITVITEDGKKAWTNAYFYGDIVK